MSAEEIKKVWDDHNAAMKEIDKKYGPIIDAIEKKYAAKAKQIDAECSPLWSKLGYCAAEAEIKRRKDGLHIQKWDEMYVPDFQWRDAIAAQRGKTDKIIAEMKKA